MIALKSSGIWLALGDGAGGHDETLGNPFPPFAVGSGFRTEGVDRKETEELGLLEPGEESQEAQIPSSSELAQRFGAKLRQYLTKLEDDERRRRDAPLTFGTGRDLLDLAQRKLDAPETLTPETIQELMSMVEKALERGVSDEDDSLPGIYELLDAPGRATECRQAAANRRIADAIAKGGGYLLIQTAEGVLNGAKQVTPDLFNRISRLVDKALREGVGEEYNLRARAYRLLASACEQIQDVEQADANRALYLQHADGFLLLNDSLDELKTSVTNLNVRKGARILDMLSRAVQKLPQALPHKHAEAYRATAEVLEFIGDTSHAIEYYEYALLKNPNSP
jgi:tetratricopeptide (TPR) repeat protein